MLQPFWVYWKRETSSVRLDMLVARGLNIQTAVARQQRLALSLRILAWGLLDAAQMGALAEGQSQLAGRLILLAQIVLEAVVAFRTMSVLELDALRTLA